MLVARFGYPPERRLRKRGHFLAVMKRGTRFFSPRFILHALPNEGPHAKLGVTVTRKVGNAVTRNRWKRLVREAFRTHPEWFATPMDLVVVVKRDASPGGLENVSTELSFALARHFRRTKL
jgi:ribonuclease P protein component